jgi:hypothetical protein
MIEPETVPDKPYIPLRSRLRWRRLMRHYAEQERAELANGETEAAQIYRQAIDGIGEWIIDSESE